jgi:uridine kinase
LYDISQLPNRPTDKLQIPLENDRDGLNDQIAAGTYDQMRVYCETFEFLEPNKTSERILLETLNLPIERFSLQYKLVLSTAKVIAIAGDSGSGKSVLCKLLRPLFLFDKVLEFETDRYHKWERGHVKWSELTHLDPTANHLEKLENDTFKLRLGDNIIAVDYDHSTGTFTPPTTIEPGETILLCGLHTMFSKQLRDLTDFKIYVDTSDEIKIKWKLQRDTTERNQNEKDVRAKIESRKQDYETFIAPQMEHADLVIKRQNTSMTLIVKKKEWCVGFPGEWIGNAILFNDESVDVRDQCAKFLESAGLPQIHIEVGYNGLIQFTVLRALYSNG